MVSLKSVKDIKLAGKRILLRADYNVPLKEGGVTANYRLTQSLPTLRYILEQKPATLIIISHLGRPAGKPDKDLSLAPVAKELEKLLEHKVHFVSDCQGPSVKESLKSLPAGSVVLLENLRFYPGEEADDSDFAKSIVEATGADVFVQDGFGVVHRAHASTSAITRLLPSVAGLLLLKEIEIIDKLMTKPERPLTAVIGGAKIGDKIEVLTKFVKLADCVAVVGALANNFLLAQGVKVGKSLIDEDNLEMADEIIKLAEREADERPFRLLIPVDGVVSTNTDGRAPTHVVDISAATLADIEAYPKMPLPSSHAVSSDEKILDIGPMTAAEIAGAIEMSKTVIWAGTCGMAEVKGIAGAAAPFAHGSRTVAEAMIGKNSRDKARPFSFVGGGDTSGYVESEGLTDDFNCVSTGGSASLELISGKKLPGIEALTSSAQKE